MIRILLIIMFLLLLILLYYKYSTLKYNFMCIKYQNKAKINNFIFTFLVNIYNTNTMLLEYLSNDFIKELLLQLRISYKVIELLKLFLKEVNIKIKKYLIK